MVGYRNGRPQPLRGRNSDRSGACSVTDDWRLQVAVTDRRGRHAERMPSKICVCGEGQERLAGALQETKRIGFNPLTTTRSSGFSTDRSNAPA
ncbi:MAG: phage DNA packaging protein J [Bryobacterales bacterium]|nr:phage DNA packaging protein J [Bryobacterales bacterium]